MSLIEDLKKELALKSKLNESVNQIPVQTVNNAQAVDAPKLTKEQKMAVFIAETIAAEFAKRDLKSASQIPVQTVAPAAPTAPVVMTHISPYPAGISKRTQKPYPSGVKWHAKPHAVGTTAYGGLSMDDIGAMLLNFPDANSLYNELNNTFEKYGKTSNMYRKAKETVIDLSK